MPTASGPTTTRPGRPRVGCVAFLDGDAYLRFMGRFSIPLTTVFADWSGLPSAGTVLDVGCGPGVLTEELVRRYGAPHVLAVDPSPAFVAAAREHVPGVEVQQGVAEELPYGNDSVDAALAQLVVHFMADPVAGLREMARVTRDGGVVAACVWDHGGGAGPVSSFWAAVRAEGFDVDDESTWAGAREGHLAQLLDEAGLTQIEDSALSVGVEHATFDDWWDPYTLGVGPAGAFLAGLDDPQREQLRQRCESLLPQAPFIVTARAWAARGSVAR
jgi:SAM-dependent methyltransferase